MMIAAIIGADSMLGRELAAQLRASDVGVISVGRAMNNDIVLDLASAPGHDIAAGRVADAVFHCASAFAGDDAEGARKNFMTNALGCLNVLSLMSQLACRHVVYAGTVSSLPGCEKPRPLTAYGLSKAHGEQILEWGMAKLGGCACSLRLAQLYDTEGRCASHQPWFGRIIAYASRGLDLRLPPSSGVRNFVHVSDAARLMVSAARQELDGSWTLCHTEMLDYTQIAELAYREFGRGGSIMIDANKTPFRRVHFPNDDSLYERLRDQPRIGMAEGVAMIHRSGHAHDFGPLDVQ